MSERYSLKNVNRAAIAGGTLALGLIVVGNQTGPNSASEESNTPPPSTEYAITKDCAKNPTAYQAFTLNGVQRLYITAGLRLGDHLKSDDAVAIDGTAREMTLTPYGQEGRTVFPDKLTPNVVQEFPFPVLGTVAIGRLHGNADPSVILACDIQALTEQGQPLEGQVVAPMPPMQ